MAITLDGTNGIDLDGKELKLDADADTSLTADTDDQIDIKIAGSDAGTLTAPSGKLTVNSSGTNLSFAVGGTVELNTDGTQFYPQTDNSHNLGTQSLRFKDMYMSGGLYVGGTGSANYFEDYEEGTWTPAIVGTSNTPTYYNQVGRYTKIGRSVTVQCFLQTNVAPTYSNTATEFKISGLPFNLVAIGYTGAQGTVNSQALSYVSGDNNQNVGGGTGGGHLTCGATADEQLILHVTASGSTRGIVENSGTTSGFILEATLTYFTDA